MEAGGLRVELARDGERACAILEEEEFDVVLSDIQMPGMSGLDLLSRVRKSHPHTEFIIMTGYASIETAVSAVNLGAHSYVQKPFVLREVQLIVERAMERRELILERERLIKALQKRVDELRAAQQEIVQAHRKLIGAERVRTFLETLVGLNHQINNLAMGITSAVACARRAHERGRPDDLIQDLAAVESQAMEIASILERALAMEDVPTVDYVEGTRMVDLEGSGITNDREPGEPDRSSPPPEEAADPAADPRPDAPPPPTP
jgi:CheY-like chemotaxis protein